MGQHEHSVHGKADGTAAETVFASPRRGEELTVHRREYLCLALQTSPGLVSLVAQISGANTFAADDQRGRQMERIHRSLDAFYPPASFSNLMNFFFGLQKTVMSKSPPFYSNLVDCGLFYTVAWLEAQRGSLYTTRMAVSTPKEW